ncbi:nucleolar protein family a, putative, partial [Eimeria necatrix]
GLGFGFGGVFLSNKPEIGKVDEILGPINEMYFSVKLNEGIKASSIKPATKETPGAAAAEAAAAEGPEGVFEEGLEGPPEGVAAASGAEEEEGVSELQQQQQQQQRQQQQQQQRQQQHLPLLQQLLHDSLERQQQQQQQQLQLQQKQLLRRQLLQLVWGCLFLHAAPKCISCFCLCGALRLEAADSSKWELSS